MLQNVNCSRSATMRRTKKQGTKKGRRLPGMREHGCWADDGLRWLGSPVADVVMLLFLSCKDISPCVFSFSFCFCFPSLSSLLSIYVLLLSSFSFSPLFFFLSFFFFFAPFLLFSPSLPPSLLLSLPLYL